MAKQQQDFAAVMAENTDLQLADVLLHPDDYVPEAIQAAKDELRRRNTTVDQLIQQRTDAVQAAIHNQEWSRSNLFRRSLLTGALSVLFCTGISISLGFLQPDPTLNDFATLQMETGGCIATMGLFLFFIFFKLRRVVVSPETSPNLSIEEMHFSGRREESIRSSIYFPLSLVGGGIVSILVALPFL